MIDLSRYALIMENKMSGSDMTTTTTTLAPNQANEAAAPPAPDPAKTPPKPDPAKTPPAPDPAKTPPSTKAPATTTTTTTEDPFNSQGFLKDFDNLKGLYKVLSGIHYSKYKPELMQLKQAIATLVMKSQVPGNKDKNLTGTVEITNSKGQKAINIGFTCMNGKCDYSKLRVISQGNAGLISTEYSDYSPARYVFGPDGELISREDAPPQPTSTTTTTAAPPVGPLAKQISDTLDTLFTTGSALHKKYFSAGYASKQTTQDKWLGGDDEDKFAKGFEKFLKDYKVYEKVDKLSRSKKSADQDNANAITTAIAQISRKILGSDSSDEVAWSIEDENGDTIAYLVDTDISES
jgi:hypothetical protein